MGLVLTLVREGVDNALGSIDTECIMIHCIAQEHEASCQALYSAPVRADPRVLCFNAADRWVQAKEPMHADIDTTCALPTP